MFETTSQTWFPKMEVPQSPQSTIGSRKKNHVMVITGMMTGVSHGKPILGNPPFFFPCSVFCRQCMSKTGSIPQFWPCFFGKMMINDGDLGMAARVSHNDLQDAGPQVGLQPAPGQSQLQGVQQQVVVHTSVGGNDLSELWRY